MFEEQITVDDYLQFCCVFNDKNENIGGNTGKNQDRQLLYRLYYILLMLHLLESLLLVNNNLFLESSKLKS
ncbi:hypothetical protein [Spiroplasma endosymbiont of Virgichneumon dumeticola]|uniref:hypothetical protein n=1 Tax=Spiroplasma endosymbiont of Virgichneumon dumeticola TaxID=3139323 RepID=UPI0035C91B3B